MNKQQKHTALYQNQEAKGTTSCSIAIREILAGIILAYTQHGYFLNKSNSLVIRLVQTDKH